MTIYCPNHKDRLGEYPISRTIDHVWETIMVCQECKTKMKSQTAKRAECRKHLTSSVETDRFGNFYVKCVKGHTWNEECDVRDEHGKPIKN